MGAFVDMTGELRGDWTVIAQAESLRRRGFVVTCWLCRCSCGTVQIVEGPNLRSGRSTRCRDCHP